MFDSTAKALDRIADELHNQFEWSKSHANSVIKDGLEQLKKLIIMTAAEATTKLNALKTQLGKANDEITKAIQDLKDAVANTGTTLPTEVSEAIDALSPAAQTLDDIVTD